MSEVHHFGGNGLSEDFVSVPPMFLQVNKKLLEGAKQPSHRTHTYSKSAVQWPEFPVEVSKVGHFQWPAGSCPLKMYWLARKGVQGGKLERTVSKASCVDQTCSNSP